MLWDGTFPCFAQTTLRLPAETRAEAAGQRWGPVILRVVRFRKEFVHYMEQPPITDMVKEGRLFALAVSLWSVRLPTSVPTSVGKGSSRESAPLMRKNLLKSATITSGLPVVLRKGGSFRAPMAQG